MFFSVIILLAVLIGFLFGETTPSPSRGYEKGEGVTPPQGYEYEGKEGGYEYWEYFLSYEPTTGAPTKFQPTEFPTSFPTGFPIVRPTKAPRTKRPSKLPTGKPSRKPSQKPSKRPSKNPTNKPSKRPTVEASGCPRVTAAPLPCCKAGCRVCSSSSS